MSQWRSGPMRSTAWRDAINPLKQEARLEGSASYSSMVKALEELSSQPNSTAVKDNEVSEDFAFLAQQLAQPRSGSRHSSGRAEVMLCRLLVQVLGGRRVRMSMSSVSVISSALRHWCDGRSAPASTGQQQQEQEQEEEDSGDMQLQCEAVQAIGVVMMRDNLSLVSASERAAILAALISLAHTPPALMRQPPPEHGRRVRPPAELQRQAILALGNCCGGETGKCELTSDELGSLLKCIVAVLKESCIGVGRVVEDAAHSRFYAALVRSTHQLVVESKKGWVPYAATLVECLRKFFLYCVSPPSQDLNLTFPETVSDGTATVTPGPSAGTAPVVSLAESSAGAAALPPTRFDVTPVSRSTGGGYRPPHLRGVPSASSASSAVASSAPVPWRCSTCGEKDDAPTSTSGTAASDLANADRFRSSRVRVAVLQCLQVMAKSDPQGLHSFWSSILPMQTPLHPRPLTPNLTTMLLFDPMPKIRSVAASTISAVVEGPAQRAYLSVAEAKQALPKPAWPLSIPTAIQQSSTSATAKPSRSQLNSGIRSFTTVSGSLGQIVQCVHLGLVAAVIGEASIGVLSVVLHALSALLSVAPFERLPQTLIPEVVQAVHLRWRSLSSASSFTPSELSPINAACFACVAEALSTKTPLPGMESYLHLDLQVPNSSSHQLISSLIEGATHPQVVVRMEALAALKGIASLYHEALGCDSTTCTGARKSGISPRWPSLKAAATLNLEEATRADLANKGRSPATSPRGRPPGIAGRDVGPDWRSGGATAAPAQKQAEQEKVSYANAIVPEDKAAQLATQLLGAYLSSLGRARGFAIAKGEAGPDLDEAPPPGASEIPPDADMEAVAAVLFLWKEAMTMLVPAASHTAYMVRSAAVAAFYELPPCLLSALGAQAQKSIILMLVGAVTNDPVANVRAMACKALGRLASYRPISEHLRLMRAQQVPKASLAVTAITAITMATKDSVMSVRMSSSWALATFCDTQRSTGPLAKAEQTHTHTQVLDPVQHKQAELRREEDEVDFGPLPVWAPLPLLAEATLAAVQDVDKVRANGVRALGALFTIIRPFSKSSTSHSGAEEEMWDMDAWLDTAIGCLQSCLTTGNMKAQWNACFATHGLLRSESLMADPKMVPRGTTLLLLLVMVVRDSSNFKIRTHAASAIAAPTTRAAYDSVYADALFVVASALESLEQGEKEGGAQELAPGVGEALPLETRGPHGTSSSSRGGATGTASNASRGAWGGASSSRGGGGGASSSSAGPEREAEEEGIAHNYRYVSGLISQLRRTLMHLLGLADRSDGVRLREAAGRRVQYLHLLLLHIAANELQAWRGELMAQAHMAPPTPGRLPADPFDSPRVPSEHTDRGFEANSNAASVPGGSVASIPMGLLVTSNARFADSSIFTGMLKEINTLMKDVSKLLPLADSSAAPLASATSATPPDAGSATLATPPDTASAASAAPPGTGSASSATPAEVAPAEGLQAGERVPSHAEVGCLMRPPLDRVSHSMSGLARLLQGAGARGASGAMVDAAAAANEINDLVARISRLGMSGSAD